MHNRFFEIAPDDWLVEIFKNLSYLERIKVSETCKRFYNLMQHHPRLSLNEKEKSRLPVKLWAECSDKEKLKENLAMGADPNQTNASVSYEDYVSTNPFPGVHRKAVGSTLLFFAANSNNIAIAEVLIKKGANVNFQNRCKLTPLHYAARNGHVEMTKFLLDHGADPTLKGQNELDGNDEPFGDATTPAELARQRHHESLALAIETNTGWKNLITAESFGMKL